MINNDYEYYYNQVPGKGQCRNNLVYTSLINNLSSPLAGGASATADPAFPVGLRPLEYWNFSYSGGRRPTGNGGSGGVDAPPARGEFKLFNKFV